MAVTPVDVGGSIAKGLQINQMRQQMEAEKQAQQDRLSLKSLYSERFGGVDPQTGIAWNTGRQGPGAMTDDQFVGRVAQVDPGMALDWRKHFAAQEEAKLERQKLEAPLFVGALEGVRDQEGYDSARQFLTQRGLDVSDMPPRYDPRQVNMVVQGSRYLAGITQPKEPGPTNLAKLISERDALPPGHPDRKRYDNAILKASTHKPSDTQTFNVGPTGVDYGDPPKDMAWARDASGNVVLQEMEGGHMAPLAVPIAGGPMAQKAKEEEEAAGQRSDAKTVQANIVSDEIDAIIDIAESSTFPVAGFGAWASAVPGTPQHDVARRLEVIKANVGFDKLQSMREASPTGGALGQVSENENRLLQSVLGSLEQSQSSDQFLGGLRRVQNIFRAAIHGVRVDGEVISLGDAANLALSSATPLDQILSEGQISAPDPTRQGAGDESGGGPTVGTVEDGYVYIGGDPASPDSWAKQR